MTPPVKVKKRSKSQEIRNGKLEEEEGLKQMVSDEITVNELDRQQFEVSESITAVGQKTRGIII